MKAGWTTKRLGELCGIELGKTPARAVAAYWDPDRRTENVWLSIADLQRAEGKVATDSKEYLSDLGAALCKPVQRGTLMVSFKLTLGRLAFAGRKLFTNEAIASLVILDERLISKEFLYWYLQAFDWHKAGEGEEKIKGVALNKALLRELLVHFPPLPEQRRIVALLDEAFAGLATAAANAERNLDNARELFESHLAEVFSRRGDGWVETTLSACTGGVFTGPFGSLLHKKDYVENGIPLVNPAHITEEGIEADSTKTVSLATASRLASYVMRRDDVVIGRRGELGRCAVVTEAQDGWLCGTGSFFIRPSNQCDSRFLVRLLRSRPVRARLDALAGGAVMPNLSNTALAGLPIDLPPMLQQRRIVELLDALALEVHRLRRVNEQKQAALAELKKSLLHQAFSGAL